MASPINGASFVHVFRNSYGKCTNDGVAQSQLVALAADEKASAGDRALAALATEGRTDGTLNGDSNNDGVLTAPEADKLISDNRKFFLEKTMRFEKEQKSKPGAGVPGGS